MRHKTDIKILVKNTLIALYFIKKKKRKKIVLECYVWSIRRLLKAHVKYITVIVYLLKTINLFFT